MIKLLWQCRMEVTGDQFRAADLGRVRDLKLRRKWVWKRGGGGGGGAADTKYYGSRIARCRKELYVKFGEREKLMKTPRRTA